MASYGQFPGQQPGGEDVGASAPGLPGAPQQQQIDTSGAGFQPGNMGGPTTPGGGQGDGQKTTLWYDQYSDSVDTTCADR